MSFLKIIKNNLFNVKKGKFLDISTKNLTGFILAASPALSETPFSQTLIYICAHNHTGTLGLIINRYTTTINAQDVFIKYLKISSLPNNLPPIRLYEGGPIEKNKIFLLHTADYRNKNTFVFRNGISISNTEDVLYDMMKDQIPQKMLFILGYSSWRPKQLDAEIKNNTWFVLPANQQLIFSEDTNILWHKSLHEFGLDPNRLASDIAHA